MPSWTATELCLNKRAESCSEKHSDMAFEADKQRGFAAELQELWTSIPSKAVFGILFAAWFALFHFLGNSTFGYFKTPSIFKWLYGIYESAPDDSLGGLIAFAVLALFWWKREAIMA